MYLAWNDPYTYITFIRIVFLVPSQVMGVTLMCDPIGLNNECTADWQVRE